MPRQRLPVASWLYEVTWAHTHVAPPVDDRRSWGKPEWPDQSPPRLLPQSFKPLGGNPGIRDGMLNVLMAQVVLDDPGIGALIG
jgi:hypothetical protein